MEFTTSYVENILEETKKICRNKIKLMEFPGMELDDIIQEAQIRIWQSLSRYDENRKPLQAYLHWIINNTIKDCLRKAHREKNNIVSYARELSHNYPSFDLDAGEFEYYCLVGDEDEGYLEVELKILFDSLLTEQEHKILNLRKCGYEFKEIASMMGLTKSRISQLWGSIKRKYITA